MAMIITKELTKHYGSRRAVDRLSLTIEEGEIFGLLGPNGAGKTTTIKMLATLLLPTSGTATINGFDIIHHPTKVRQSIGIVFQEPSSDELLTGYENLRMHALLYGIPRDVAERRIDEALALVELHDRKNDLLKTYSGGMRRRLEIARGLLHRPAVLFLDEPTLGLDPRGREAMWKYIRRLVNELHITILLTTHYMEEADTLSDRIAIIDRGTCAIVDTPHHLKKSIGGEVVILRGPSLNPDAFRHLPFISRIDGGSSSLSLTVSHAAQHLTTILEHAGPLDSIEIRSPTLEDVFLRYTGRGLEQPESSFFDKVISEKVNA